MQMFLQHGSYKSYNTDVLTITDAEDDTLLSVESMVNEEFGSGLRPEVVGLTDVVP